MFSAFSPGLRTRKASGKEHPLRKSRLVRPAMTTPPSPPLQGGEKCLRKHSLPPLRRGGWGGGGTYALLLKTALGY